MMMPGKLSIDEQFVLASLLRKLDLHDFGELSEFVAGNWSRRNLEAMLRDLAGAPLKDLRR